MAKTTDSFHEVAQAMVNVNWELRGDLNVAADTFCADNAIFDARAVREAMELGAVLLKRRELLNTAVETRRVIGDRFFEVWATQGQGGVLDASYPTLEAALAHLERHKGSASFGIKLPSGDWFDLETGIESISYAGACSVCGEVTDMACSDCRIDFQKTVYVCRKTACRDTHEQRCPASTVEEL